MSDEFQNFKSPLGKSLEQNTKQLETIAHATGFFSTETNIFTEILDVLEVDSLAHKQLGHVVTFLGKWDKNVGKIVHGRVLEANIQNFDKKDYLRKHGINYMIQRAHRDMDELIETLDQLRNAVGNAKEEFNSDNSIYNNEHSNNDESSDSDHDENNEGDNGETLDDHEIDIIHDFEQGRNVLCCVD